jgi:FtsH-binding integral membrane protein
MSDSHGNTPAAWTAVVVGLIGFLISSVGITYLGHSFAWPLFWIGVAVFAAGGVIFVVMSKLGLNVESH